MKTLDEIRALLQDRRIDKVAKATGLHRNTVTEIRDGMQTNPTLRVMLLLSDYLTNKGG